VKITEIEPIPLRLPFAQPFKISQGARETLETLIVRVHTDEGIVGIGETQAWRRQGSAELLWSLVRTIKDHFEPLIAGRSPFDIGGILQTLNEALYNTLYAQAAVADALYDIAGKAVGLPVHKLLAGECRDRVRIGGLLAMKPTVGELMESAQAFYERGFRHFGLKIGLDPRQDLANVLALRERFGDRVVLRVDANGALSYDAALALLKKLEPHDIDVAEQPIAIWDLDGLAALCRATSIPIMADESVSTDHSLLEVIRRRAATVVQRSRRTAGCIACGGSGHSPPRRACASIPATIRARVSPRPRWRSSAGPGPGRSWKACSRSASAARSPPTS
jgi:L-alanine-DL-glutamate epimerase-like enolase superfamily enzyme